MARAARLIVIGLLCLALAAPLMACGRKGPLEPPGQDASPAAQAAPDPAPATPEPDDEARTP